MKQLMSKIRTWLLYIAFILILVAVALTKIYCPTEHKEQNNAISILTPTPEDEISPIPTHNVSPTPVMLKKPVIYVYNYSGSVQININTKFKPVNLDPEFNIQSGWQFTVQDNKIILNNKTYPYLFYEIELTPGTLKLSDIDINPVAYLTVNTRLFEQLIDIFMQIGMTKDEATDMAQYWAKDLEKINTSHIRVALLNKQRIHELAILNINPKPAYVTRVIFVFTPVNIRNNTLMQNTHIHIQPMINNKMSQKYIVIEYGGFVSDIME